MKLCPFGQRAYGVADGLGQSAKRHGLAVGVAVTVGTGTGDIPGTIGAGGCDREGAGLLEPLPDREGLTIAAWPAPVAGETASALGDGLGDGAAVGSAVGSVKGVWETSVWRSWMVAPVDGRLGFPCVISMPKTKAPATRPIVPSTCQPSNKFDRDHSPIRRAFEWRIAGPSSCDVENRLALPPGMSRQALFLAPA